MDPCSEYAIDTRRMIATGRVRQGIREWPQNTNYPNNELLGRYDLYPQPSGKEQQSAARLREEAPPTGPPDGQILYPQNGVSGVRLNRKTNASGAANPKASTQANRKIKKNKRPQAQMAADREAREASTHQGKASGGNTE